ncbi:hypothetical protein Tco_1430247 [Tanacetum coccineum]
MPSFTMKWLFSQFRTKLVSSHRFNILSKWDRHVEKESPKTEKSSIKYFPSFSDHVHGRLHHTSLGMLPGALHSPKGHAGGRQNVLLWGASKGCLFLVLRVYGNLEITRKAIEETIELVSRESFEHLVHEGKWKVVLSGSLIQLSIVDAYSPPCDQSSRYKIIFIVFDDGHATLLWYTMHRAYPWTVRDRINQSGVKKLFNFFLDDVMDFWIYPPLMLNRWFVVLFHENFVGTKLWVDTLDIRKFPSDGSLVGL